MATSIDTNALIALLSAEEPARRVAACLHEQRRYGRLYVSSFVFAELCVSYDPSQLQPFLNELHIEINLSSDVAVLVDAAARWRGYLQRKRAATPHYPCHACGHITSLECPHCRAPIRGPKLILADFLIGADALHHANALVTLDRGVYTTYFPDLAVLPN